MTSRDNNRVVRPFEWGNEFVRGWPVVGQTPLPANASDTAANLAFWAAVNDRIVANSDDYYTYNVPTDFGIEHRRVELFHTGSEAPKKQLKESYGQFLRFTSAAAYSPRTTLALLPYWSLGVTRWPVRPASSGELGIGWLRQS